MEGPDRRPRGERARNARGEGARLADEIVDAALGVFDDLGNGREFSLRAVASRARIAAPSIYRHFPDKDSLVSAVMMRLFDELAADRDEAERRVCDLGGSMWDRLLARSLAYARFGTERGGHYRLLYEDAATVQLASETAAACGAAMTLRTRDLLMDVLPPEIRDRQGEAERSATLLWTALHGLVSLRLHRPHLAWPPIEEDVVRVQQAIVPRPEA